MSEPKGMTGNEYHRTWEDAEMDLRLLEAEIARFGASLAKVRRIHRDLYEGALKRPAPEYGAPVSMKRRAS